MTFIVIISLIVTIRREMDLSWDSLATSIRKTWLILKSTFLVPSIVPAPQPVGPSHHLPRASSRSKQPMLGHTLGGQGAHTTGFSWVLDLGSAASTNVEAEGSQTITALGLTDPKARSGNKDYAVFLKEVISSFKHIIRAHQLQNVQLVLTARMKGEPSMCLWIFRAGSASSPQAAASPALQSIWIQGGFFPSPFLPTPELLFWLSLWDFPKLKQEPNTWLLEEIILLVSNHNPSTCESKLLRLLPHY